MTTQQADIAAAPSELALLASLDGRKLPRVEIVAYTGGVMSVPGWGDVAIDLSGLELSGTVPILSDHDSTRRGIVGHGRAEAKAGRLLLAGSISAGTAAAREIVEAAKNGFPWQASVAAEVLERRQVPAGQTAAVNGKSLAAPAGGMTLQTVRDIFGLFTDGMGYKSIADELNRRGVPSPRKDFWSFTTIKSLLANPVYQGDLVWNRRTEAKFYAVREGRADKMRPSQESARVTLTRREDWIVIPDAVPAIVDRSTWQKAQVQVSKRPAARGGIGHRNRCWLLTGVLQCGDCGHKYWGEPKKKGRIEGRAPVVTNYYTCAGRRSHGKLICPTPAHVRAEELEGWVLGNLERLVMGDAGGTSYALDRIVTTLMGEDGSTGEVERIEGELGKVRETVAALTASIDPANLALLNDRLTQLRLHEEHLEQELAAAKLAGHGRDEGEIRRWAERQLAGLADALDGRRDDETRRVLGSYVDRITLWPSTKRGEMELSDDLWPFLCPEKQHDRPEGRSCGNQIAGVGLEPTTSGL